MASRPNDLRFSLRIPLGILEKHLYEEESTFSCRHRCAWGKAVAGQCVEYNI